VRIDEQIGKKLVGRAYPRGIIGCTRDRICKMARRQPDDAAKIGNIIGKLVSRNADQRGPAERSQPDTEQVQRAIGDEAYRAGCRALQLRGARLANAATRVKIGRQPADDDADLAKFGA